MNNYFIKSNIVDIVLSGLTFLTISGILCTIYVCPYFFNCCRSKSIYKNDDDVILVIENGINYRAKEPNGNPTS